MDYIAINIQKLDNLSYNDRLYLRGCDFFGLYDKNGNINPGENETVLNY